MYAHLYPDTTWSPSPPTAQYGWFWIEPKQTQDSPQRMLKDSQNSTEPIDNALGLIRLLPSNNNLAEVLTELVQLLQEPELGDDTVRTSETAFKLMYDLIFEVGAQVGSRFPYAATYIDGEGGLRAEWTGKEGDVRLVVPSTTNEAYIFHEQGQSYAADDVVTSKSLADWLDRLIIE